MKIIEKANEIAFGTLKPDRITVDNEGWDLGPIKTGLEGGSDASVGDPATVLQPLSRHPTKTLQPPNSGKYQAGRRRRPVNLEKSSSGLSSPPPEGFKDRGWFDFGWLILFKKNAGHKDDRRVFPSGCENSVRGTAFRRRGWKFRGCGRK